MILQLKHGSAGAVPVPDEWRSFVSAGDGACEIRGDDSGRVVLHLCTDDRGTLLSDSLAELLETYHEPPRLSPRGLSFLLHDGQVPYPESVYEGIYSLTIGDRAVIAGDAREPSLSFSVDFPYFSDLSRGDQTPDTDRLLSLLSDATSRLLEGVEEAVLLLSAGKDSTVLALALAECGRTDVTCLTYTSPGDDEHVHARKTCERLGLRHEVVGLDSCGSDLPSVLTSFFEACPLPPGDLSQIPTVVLMSAVGISAGGVIEGTGNDATFGYVPRPKDARLARLCIGRWSWTDGLKRLIRPSSELNYLLRDPVETNWPGLRVRHVETSRLFPGAVNTSEHWRAVRRELRGRDLVETRTLLRGRHFEVGSQRQKIDLATRARGLTPLYPFQDPAVTDYYFNLPESERFDRYRLVNKVLLRRLLHERLDYDTKLIGKRGFRFDGAEFLQRHRDYVIDEIRSCELFDARGLGFLPGSLKTCSRADYGWHHIVGLFQLAAWHNHSRYLKPGQAQYG